MAGASAVAEAQFCQVCRVAINPDIDEVIKVGRFHAWLLPAPPPGVYWAASTLPSSKWTPALHLKCNNERFVIAGNLRAGNMWSHSGAHRVGFIVLCCSE